MLLFQTRPAAVKATRTPAPSTRPSAANPPLHRLAARAGAAGAAAGGAGEWAWEAAGGPGGEDPFREDWARATRTFAPAAGPAAAGHNIYN